MHWRTARRARNLRAALLTVAVLLAAVGMLPELVQRVPDLNDRAFHAGLLRETRAALAGGRNPLDFWVPTWLAGYPLLPQYQPLPYIGGALVQAASGDAVSADRLTRWLTVLPLMAYPFTLWLGLRWCGLGANTAVSAALLALSASGGGRYGIEFESFTWAGSGLMAQAVALPFLPLALGAGWRAVHGRRRTLGAALLLAVTCLCHVLYGYLAVLSLMLVPLLGPTRARANMAIRHLVRLGFDTACLVGFFVVPIVLGQAYHGRSVYDPIEKFDSLGVASVLSALVSGELLDHGRFPALTILVAIGFYLAIRRWLERGSTVHGWVALGFVFWVIMYFGRATWGPLMDLLPMSRGLHMERLSNGVQFFAIVLAALPVGALLQWAVSSDARVERTVAGLAAIALLLVPIARERGRYLIVNGQLLAAAAARYTREAPAFDQVMARLGSEAPGRVYAGHSGNWGRTYTVGSVPAYQLLSAQGIPTIGHAPFSWPISTDYQFQFDPTERAHYALFDVRYLLTDRANVAPPGAELIAYRRPHRLYRIPSTQSEVRPVYVPVAVVGSAEDTWPVGIAWMRSAWPTRRWHVQLAVTDVPAPERSVLRIVDPLHFEPGGLEGERYNVLEAPQIFRTPDGGRPDGTVRVAESSPEMVRATVELAEPAVAMLQRTYHPGWAARVDGQSRPTIALTPGFVGVEVPAGVHDVEFEYGSGWTRAWLFAVGLVGLIGARVVSRRRSWRHVG